MGVWCLRSKPDSEFACRFMIISHAAAGLNWRRVDTWNKHLLLDNDTISLRLSKCSISLSLLTRFPVINLICRLLILFIRPQQRGIGIKRFLGIDNHWQWLVINLD